MSNINNFLSSFKTDIARPCNYTVELHPSAEFFGVLNRIEATDGALQNIFRKVDSLSEVKTISEFRCEQAEFPARAFSLVDQKTYGPIEQFPVQNSYNRIPMVFMCSDDMREKLFFDLWMETICPSHPSINYNTLNNGNGSVRFDFEYKSKYRSDVIIRQRDLNGNPSYSVALRDAFPVEVYSLPLSWRVTDDYHRLNVVFVYRYFYPLTSATGGETT